MSYSSPVAPNTHTPYDVFLSYTGNDLRRALEIKEALEARGLEVFLDRERVRHSYGVSTTIEKALRRSRMMLVYYSERYSRRWACQFELTQAVIADEREGNERGRVFVVKDPGFAKQRIHLPRLRDQLYLDDNGPVDNVVRVVLDHFADLTGTFQGIDFARVPRSYGGTGGDPGGVRRYAAMARLHGALRVAGLPMTHQSLRGPTVLTGLPGAGKTRLVDDYVAQFGYAYPAGVVRTSLPGSFGAEETGLLADYAGDVGRLFGVTGKPSAVFADVTNFLDGKDDVLWVVDDAPPDPPRAFLELPMFGLPTVHLLLVTTRAPTSSAGVVLDVGGLNAEEGLELIKRYRAIDDDEVPTVLSVVDRVGGHPMAVNQIAIGLRERVGLSTVLEQVGRELEGTTDTLVQVAILVESQLSTLDDGQRAVLRLAAVCAPDPLPMRFVLAVAGLAEHDLLAAVRSLTVALLITREGETLRVHPVVRDAVRRRPDTGPDPAMAAAAHLVAALRVAEDSDRHRLLASHAVALVTGSDLPGDTVEDLLSAIARHHAAAGAPAVATRWYDRLLVHRPDDPAVLAPAAHCHEEAGEYEEASRLAGHALRSGGLPADRATAVVVLASALDALGRFPDADPVWARVIAPDTLDALPPDAAWMARLWWAGALRRRGRFPEHRAVLDQLLGAGGTPPASLRHHALLERAREQLLTDRQPDARENAGRVVAHYEGLDQPHHPLAREARFVAAEADLVLHLFELNTDPAVWARAAAHLRVLAGELAAELGTRNIRVLTVRASAAEAWISTGQPTEALRDGTSLLADLAGRLPAEHPLRLQVEYVLGMAHFQLADFTRARAHLEHSHHGRRAVLGARHPDTLRTQFELGMAHKLDQDGDNRRANALIDEVRRTAPFSTGRRTDLFGQAAVASTLTRLVPRSLLRWAHRSNHQHKWPDRS